MKRLDPQTPADQSSEPGSDDARTPSGGFDPWRYRDDATVISGDLVGYHVAAIDGAIGKIDSAGREGNASFLVVDTGPWIFGKKVMLPAGVVNHVDHDDRKVYVDRSRDQIKAAPEYDESSRADPGHRKALGGHYGETSGPDGTMLAPYRPL